MLCHVDDRCQLKDGTVILKDVIPGPSIKESNPLAYGMDDDEH